MLKVTVVAPVYNEEEVISDFHSAVSSVLNSISEIDYCILYVVDRCTDRTVGILREIASRDERTRVVLLSARFGHQASLVAGIERSLDSDAIVMMDSDLQHPPELIPALIVGFRSGFDIVYTVRADTENVHPLRKFVGYVFYRLLSNIAEAPLKSNTADFRLISKRVANALIQGFKERNLFLRGLFPWMGFNQMAVEYTARSRKAGRSKYSLSRSIRLATHGILSFSTKPLQLGIFIGGGFSCLSFTMAVWAVVEYFVNSSLPSGWTTLIVLLLMFSGVQLVILGIIGAYIGGIYDEVKHRPRYIVEEEIMFRGTDRCQL